MSNELEQLVELIHREEEQIRAGGGQRAIDRQHAKGRLTARERIDVLDYRQTDVHLAVGGGAKIALAGPLKVRLDYRIFRLRGARQSNAQRLYGGLALAF